MIFGPTSIVLAARFEVVRRPQFKLIIWLVLNCYEKYNTRKVLFRYAFCLFFATLTSKSMKISLILNNIATWFKVGGICPTLCQKVWGIFSSPEHKVLMVNFCDRPMSGVCHSSCVVHNFFKHCLLPNHWANLDETWQECSLGEALPKVFKRLNSNHNSGCHGNLKEKYSKIFENLLLWN